MSKLYYLLLSTILLLSCTPVFAQEQPADEPLVLLFSKAGTNRGVWFMPGDTIRYRLKQDKEWTIQVFKNFTTDGDLRFTIDTIALTDFYEIDVYEKDRSRRLNRAYGVSFLTASLGLLLIDQFNEILLGAKPNLSWRVVSISGGLMAGSLFCFIMGRRGQRVNHQWRLKITPLPQRFIQ